MSTAAPVLSFFNAKGGVGKTTLVYQLAWMFASLHRRVLVVDLDPQSTLTAAFLEEDRIEELWSAQEAGSTIFQCVKPVTEGGLVVDPVLQEVARTLFLLPGDIELAGFEEPLADAWSASAEEGSLYRPMSILSSFWQVIRRGAAMMEADIVLVDTAANLGAINRSVLIASDFFIIPLAPDPASLHGLKSLGQSLRRWRAQWDRLRDAWRSREAEGRGSFDLPPGRMQALGYVCKQFGFRPDLPRNAFTYWARRFSEMYWTAVRDQKVPATPDAQDPEYLATIKHYWSLLALGREARKPIFKLTPADGALGSHAAAARDAKKDYEELAAKIAGRMGMPL